MARSKLTEQDKAQWASYVRHVRPLPGRAAPALLTGIDTARTQARADGTPKGLPARAAQPLSPVAAGIQPPGLDNASWNRLRGGKLTPSRTLDLHGKSAQSAFHLVERFLHTAHAERLRCVEIITGRGSGEAGGVLRRELPIWLNLPAIRPMILAATQPHAANHGALRILLRRTRP